MRGSVELVIKNRWISIFSLFFLGAVLFFQQEWYGYFGKDNYVMIHLMIEILLIVSSIAIAIQAWMFFPHVFSQKRLWMGAIFLSVGVLEIFHALSYKGMPYFLSESSAYKATWFYLLSRLTLAIGLLLFVFAKEKQALPFHRWMAYCVSLAYSLIWIFIIFDPNQLLPEVVVEGAGTTAVKNTLQYLAILIQSLCIFFCLKTLRSSSTLHLMLLVGSVYLIISDFLFTTYMSVYDMANLTGHFFQLAAYYFVFTALYYVSVKEPYQKLKEAKEQLQEKERFLHTITSSMGEGIIVMDMDGNVTFVNPKAEQLLLWQKDELVGMHYSHLIQEADATLPSHQHVEHTASMRTTDIQLNQMHESFYIRKDKTTFPGSYITTPFIENGNNKGFIMVFRDMSQQKRDQEYITYMANHDELTQLPNARFFLERLSDVLEQNNGSKVAILLLDIDRFKSINESLGISFGDLVLKTVASRIHGALPSEVFFSRLRGDEFALFVASSQADEETISISQRIQEIMREPFALQHLLLNITVSIGIAVCPDDGHSRSDLVKYAQIAKNEAKREGQRFKRFHPTMDKQLLERLVLEHDLHKALSRDEFLVVYQPQIDVHTGQIISVEALIRWNHPVRGWISPLHFIPLAEENGLIVPIGEWMLRTACRQLKEWHNQGFTSLGVSVNLSMRQFFQQDLVDMIDRILKESKLSSPYLELEITESMTMNVNHTIDMLHKLKKLGVKIAVDDFGTGYSSLLYLKEFPIDRLKIDRSFIRDVTTNKHDAAIISMIVSIANHLEMEVIAEGVEHVDQLDFLWEQQCRQVQGYLFSPPILPEQLPLHFHEIQKRSISYRSRVGM
ncbi:EAL domain-containing protein [Brevibacillus nitrificans]|uniref:EAL domain-containing protein n=1 Tax=Brevibacillus nitrificans TaxID=651560 RepID=A0A3M8DB24_9BACL|nr:EAL domain-containing protein [Brevibacillus nitrificans]RNB84809.1 EAL domain-containing protein [Brevibacillus nitrificans]